MKGIMKTLKISTEHSSKTNRMTKIIKVDLEGGSPWFTYLWIDDVCYTVIKGERTVKIEKTISLEVYQIHRAAIMIEQQ